MHSNQALLVLPIVGSFFLLQCGPSVTPAQAPSTTSATVPNQPRPDGNGGSISPRTSSPAPPNGSGDAIPPQTQGGYAVPISENGAGQGGASGERNR